MKFFILLSLFFSLTANAITYEGFHQLSEEEKIDYLYGMNPEIVYSVTLKKVTELYLSHEDFLKVEEKLKQVVHSLENYEPGFDTDVYDDDYYATVGNVEANADLYFSEDHKFLGGRILYWQKGCSHFGDDNEPTGEVPVSHYPSYEEAHANNCFDNDVSWSGASIFDENFKELMSDDYMEWTGH